MPRARQDFGANSLPIVTEGLVQHENCTVPHKCQQQASSSRMLWRPIELLGILLLRTHLYYIMSNHPPQLFTVVYKYG